MEPCLFAVDGNSYNNGLMTVAHSHRGYGTNKQASFADTGSFEVPHANIAWADDVVILGEDADPQRLVDKLTVWMFSDGTGTCQVWTTAKFQGWQNGGNC